MKRLWCAMTWSLAVWTLCGSIAAWAHVDEELEGPEFLLPQSPRDVLLATVLDAEIKATRQYVELLETKAALLERLVQSEQARLEKTSANAPAMNSTRSWHRPSSKRANEQFDDWLASQGTWASPPETSSTALHVGLISFRPNGNVGNKRNGHASRQNSHDPTAPSGQFLMVFNKESGCLDLLHPMTLSLVWQQRLEISAPIARVIFHSDRSSHLILVTIEDELLVYKIRIFHSRRLVAGDYRRHSGMETATCNARVSLPIEARHSRLGYCLQRNPFVRPHSIHTIAPVGLHTHVEIDFEYAAKSPRKLLQATMVASHQSLFLVASSEEGPMGVFDGHNGSFLGEVDIPLSGKVGYFQALSSGVVAFSVHNRIHFFDAHDRRLLGLRCEGSRHAITSLERDAWRHTVLVAGTSDGKGLVFRLNRFGSIKRNNGLVPIGADAIHPFDESDLGFPSCTLTAILQPRARIFDRALGEKSAKSAIVTAMPGHVLLATGDGHLVLYDTTSDASTPVYLAEKCLAQGNHTSRLWWEVTVVQAGKDAHAGTASVAVVVREYSSSRVRVELFAAWLTPSSSALDIGWIRAPMMLFCAFGVMFWQQNRFRRPSSSALDLDLAGATKRARQYGRGGGLDWSRSTNHRVFSGR